MKMMQHNPTAHHLSAWRPPATVITALLMLNAAVATAQQRDPLRVVTTLPTYAAIAREVTGDLARVDAIARGDEDPHFVNARPSFAAMLQRADIFVVTGLDLELWVPALLDRANNQKVVEGGPGHVVAYSGVTLLEIPESVSRTGGDVHVFGNPHIHTDPVNGILIARNIVAGLKRVDPANAAVYERNLQDFADRIMARTFGAEFLGILGSETVFDLARNHRFWDFVDKQAYQGKPLSAYLGGWLAEGEPFRNKRMVCYHKNWAYFSARFRVECAMYVESKPGIPASPGHVRDVIEFIRSEKIPVLFAANYFSKTQVDRVAGRTGITGLSVPEHVAGAEGVDTYFDLIDLWVSRLAATFQPRSAHP